MAKFSKRCKPTESRSSMKCKKEPSPKTHLDFQKHNEIKVYMHIRQTIFQNKETYSGTKGTLHNKKETKKT
jgi:hypothetical protein